MLLEDSSRRPDKPMSNGSHVEGGYNKDEIRSGILAEINDLKATAQAFGWEAIQDGSWFNQFLTGCLSGYHERVMRQGGEAYLRGKYPGLPIEAVAGKLCELAEQTAAIAGSLSGAAASGAVLTAGAGIPVALTAVMAEVLFTVRLQLRLVYDLHLIYGIPLDASDPEDLLGVFAVVYGVKIAEVGGVGAKALGPEVMRAQLYRLIHGNTKLIQQAVSRVLGPRIARSVTPPCSAPPAPAAIRPWPGRSRPPSASEPAGGPPAPAATPVFPSSQRPHHLIKQGPEQGVFVRLGSTNRQADPALIEELRRSVSAAAFDEQPMLKLTPADLDHAAIASAFEGIR
jgi:hypothetical protein